MIIYRVWNKETKESFIGFTSKLQEGAILTSLYCNRKSRTCRFISSQMGIHGKEKFDVQTLLSLPDSTPPDEIDLNLQIYIGKYHSYYPGGYNLKKGLTEGFRFTDTQLERHAINHNKPEVKAKKVDSRRKRRALVLSQKNLQ